MASNLSSIGFVFESAEDFQATMLRLAPDATERLGCEVGEYAIWRSRTGVEIWFHLPFLGTEDDARDIAGLTPFYEGLGMVDVEIVERLNRPDDNAFEGAFTAQVRDPDGSNEGFPLTFDAVDFAAHTARDLPFTAQARIVGFARNLRAFADDAAYASSAASEGGGMTLAPRAFIPVGQLADLAEGEGAAAAPPASTALLTGRVVEHRRLVNEATGRDFHWLMVETYAAVLDIVADPDCVSGDIVEGGTVEVGCVLIGRLAT
jgi:hypothetical protein